MRSTADRVRCDWSLSHRRPRAGTPSRFSPNLGATSNTSPNRPFDHASDQALSVEVGSIWTLRFSTHTSSRSCTFPSFAAHDDDVDEAVWIRNGLQSDPRAPASGGFGHACGRRRLVRPPVGRLLLKRIGCFKRCASPGSTFTGRRSMITNLTACRLLPRGTCLMQRRVWNPGQEQGF